MSSVFQSVFQSIDAACTWGSHFPRGGNLLLVRGVRKSIAGVHYAEVVHVLNIARTEVKTHLESLCEEVNSVECFGLGFGNGREVWRSREGLIPCEGPSDALDYDSLFIIRGSGHVMKQGKFVVWTIRVAETARGESCHKRSGRKTPGENDTDFSATQSPARVAIRSGRVSASSLYTLQLLDSLL